MAEKEEEESSACKIKYEVGPDGNLIAKPEGNCFVIQEHCTDRGCHTDLRILKAGKMLGFTIPKGIPQESGVRRLAIPKDEKFQDLKWITFEGPIPEGEYGAGDMKIVDSGSYDVINDEFPEKISIKLKGKQFQGDYALYRAFGENKYLILRKTHQEEASSQKLSR